MSIISSRELEQLRKLIEESVERAPKAKPRNLKDNKVYVDKDRNQPIIYIKGELYEINVTKV
jgi:hypothetical protein